LGLRLRAANRTTPYPYTDGSDGHVRDVLSPVLSSTFADVGTERARKSRRVSAKLALMSPSPLPPMLEPALTGQ